MSGDVFYPHWFVMFFAALIRQMWRSPRWDLFDVCGLAESRGGWTSWTLWGPAMIPLMQLEIVHVDCTDTTWDMISAYFSIFQRLRGKPGGAGFVWCWRPPGQLWMLRWLKNHLQSVLSIFLWFWFQHISTFSTSSGSQCFLFLGISIRSLQSWSQANPLYPAANGATPLPGASAAGRREHVGLQMIRDELQSQDWQKCCFGRSTVSEVYWYLLHVVTVRICTYQYIICFGSLNMSKNHELAKRLPHRQFWGLPLRFWIFQKLLGSRFGEKRKYTLIPQICCDFCLCLYVAKPIKRGPVNWNLLNFVCQKDVSKKLKRREADPVGHTFQSFHDMAHNKAEVSIMQQHVPTLEQSSWICFVLLYLVCACLQRLQGCKKWDSCCMYCTT